MREPTKREQRMDSLYDSLSERIDEYGLDPQDAIHVVEDILISMIADSDEDSHDYVGAFLARLPAKVLQHVPDDESESVETRVGRRVPIRFEKVPRRVSRKPARRQVQATETQH
jgi:hypothetical protein